jgi:hypothetical protein
MKRLLSIISSIFLLILITVLIFNQRIFGTDTAYELIQTEPTRESVKTWRFLPSTEGPTVIILTANQQRINSLNNPEDLDFALPEDAINTVFSRLGKFFALIRMGNSSNSTEDRIITIEVYSVNGDRLYEIPFTHYYDNPLPIVAISDDGGSAVIGQRVTGEVWFYNQSGALINNLQLFPEAQYDLERTLFIEANNNGSRIAITASKRAVSPAGSGIQNESGEPHLFLFSATAEEIWRANLPLYFTNALTISDDGEFLAVNNSTITTQGQLTKKTIVFDGNTHQIGEMDLFFKQAHFSADSKYLIVAENNQAKIFNIESASEEWDYQLPKAEGLISSVRVSNNGETAVLLTAKSEFQENKFVFTNPVLKILNKEREIIQELPIKDQTFENPAVYLAPNAELIYVGFENEYQIYQAVQ